MVKHPVENKENDKSSNKKIKNDLFLCSEYSIIIFNLFDLSTIITSHKPNTPTR